MSAIVHCVIDKRKQAGTLGSLFCSRETLHWDKPPKGVIAVEVSKLETHRNPAPLPAPRLFGGRCEEWQQTHHQGAAHQGWAVGHRARSLIDFEQIGWLLTSSVCCLQNPASETWKSIRRHLQSTLGSSEEVWRQKLYHYLHEGRHSHKPEGWMEPGALCWPHLFQSLLAAHMGPYGALVMQLILPAWCLVWAPLYEAPTEKTGK